MREQPFKLQPNQHIYPNLPFYPSAIRIDNPTSAYVFFPDVGKWVDPYTLGRIIDWSLTQTQIEIRTDITPDGTIPSSTFSPSKIIGIIFTDESLPEDPGRAFRVGQQVSQQNLATQSFPPNVVTNGQPLTLPPGTHSVGLVVSNPGIGAPAGSIDIKVTGGSDGGAIYYDSKAKETSSGRSSPFLPGTVLPVVVPLQGTAAQTITVSVDATQQGIANASNFIIISAILDVESLVIVQNPEDSWHVTLDPSTSAVVTTTPSRGSLPSASALINNTLNNSSAIIIPGIAGQVIDCYTLVILIQNNPGTSVFVEDTAGNLFTFLVPLVVQEVPVDLKGQRSALGAGIRLRNPNPTPTTVYGSLSYNQHV